MASSVEDQERFGWRIATDAVGLGLVAALLAWRALAAAVGDGDAVGAIGFTLVVLGAFVGGRLLTRLDAAAVPIAAVVVGVAVIVAATPEEIFADGPLSGPWHYSAVTGAFFAQLAIGASLLLTDRRSTLKPMGAAAAVFAAVPIATETWTVVLVAAAMVPIALLIRYVHSARTAISACWIVAMLIVGASAIVAAMHQPGDRTALVERVVDRTITERRVERQHDAWEMLVDHPVLGVGHGNYAELSPSVAMDGDAPWAHNDFLQLGAEAGLPALVLLVALPSWAFLRLRRSMTSRTRSVLVAVSVLLLVAHACTEQVVDRPVVPAVTAALVACALRPRGARSSP